MARAAPLGEGGVKRSALRPLSCDIEVMRALAREILLHYFSRARGGTVTIPVGRYCYRRGIRSPSVLSVLYSIIESELSVVECNGSRFKLVEMQRQYGRRRVVRYQRGA